MSEAIERLDSLITQAQTDSPKLYPLDQTEHIVAINIPGRNMKVWHKVRKPTFGELKDRDQQMPYESEEISAEEQRQGGVDDVTPNAALWDKIRLQVKGYRWRDIRPDQWVDVTDELAAEIPSGHKSAAIIALYETSFEMEYDDEDGFALGATLYRVKQTVGPYTIYHLFRKPAEGERREFRRKATETRFRGMRRIKSRIYSKLEAYTNLYDRIFQELEGVTGDDPAITRRHDLVDAMWKRGAIDCFMRSFEGAVSD